MSKKNTSDLSGTLFLLVASVACFSSVEITAATIGHYTAPYEVLGLGVTQFFSSSIVEAVDDLTNAYGQSVVSTHEVTPSFLANVDFFYTGLVYSIPTQDQNALRNFVYDGGTLTVQQDQPHAVGFGAATNLLSKAFSASPLQTFTGSNFIFNDSLNEPLLTRPNELHGESIEGISASSYWSFPGFSIAATSTLDGQPVIIVGSFEKGRVIGLADINLFDDRVYERNNINGKLWQNLFSIPEPSSVILGAMLIGSGLVARRIPSVMTDK